ncbi:MAG: hypothetical protein E7068_02490 [Lentimicrobiaceae bacterium]|nr:hypothetical protein [Lentimicrobiaceae bacterium]
METEKGFYMVFMEGGNTPAYKHAEKESAIKEARRLAETHKKKTYLLATVTSFEYDCIKIKEANPCDLRIEDALPF